jgi:hypothetical protein
VATTSTGNWDDEVPYRDRIQGGLISDATASRARKNRGRTPKVLDTHFRTAPSPSPACAQMPFTPLPELAETHELDNHPRESDRVDDRAVRRIVALQKLRCYTGS